MNKVLTILSLLALMVSCTGKYKSIAPQANVSDPSVPSERANGDTLWVDLARSQIKWKGAKMRGAGKHEGLIQLQQAYFITSDGQLSGGKFMADMNTIEVTDIPAHEPVPRQRFNDHMKSEDFFDAETFPTSKFEITHVSQLTADSLEVAGNLTIKDITKNITFRAERKQGIFSARFAIDRFQWNIAYEGSWAHKTLVDREIELTIVLKT